MSYKCYRLKNYIIMIRYEISIVNNQYLAKISIINTFNCFVFKIVIYTYNYQMLFFR